MSALAILAWAATVGADVLRPDRLGAVRIGMTLAQAERALGQHLRREADRESAGRDCGYVRGASGRVIAWYMRERGRMTRIDAADRSIRTARRVGIGTSIADLRRAFGPALASYRDVYTAEPDFDLGAADGKYALVFETEKGVVMRMRAGRYPPGALYRGMRMTRRVEAARGKH